MEVKDWTRNDYLMWQAFGKCINEAIEKGYIGHDFFGMPFVVFDKSNIKSAALVLTRARIRPLTSRERQKSYENISCTEVKLSGERKEMALTAIFLTPREYAMLGGNVALNCLSEAAKDKRSICKVYIDTEISNQILKELENADIDGIEFVRDADGHILGYNIEYEPPTDEEKARWGG